MKKCCTTQYCFRLLFYPLPAFLLLFFVGCIPVLERQVVPFDNLPAVYSVQGEIPAKVDWWLDFNDPDLNKLVEISVDENFTVQIARTRIDELRAGARLAGASLIPSIDGKLSTSSTRDYSNSTSSETFFFEFAASYELDLWGRISSQRDAALLEMQVSEEDFHTAVITIAAELAQIWYQLGESNMQLELLDKQIEVNSKILELISTQYRSGKVGVADILQQQQLLESNSEDQASLKSEIKVLKHKLAILLGKPPTTPLPFKVAALPDLPPLPKTGVPLDLLTTRPDIMSSFLKLRASDYRVAAAVADRFPKLSISADVSSSSDRAEDLFNDWFSSLGANLLGPLIDGGKRKAEVDRREAIAAQNFLRYGQTVLQAIGEVEDALVQERAQQKILTSRQNQLKLATDALKHVGNRYRQGVDDYQRVLIVLLSLQNLERNILKSKRTLINNRIALYRATSGRLFVSDQTLSTDSNPLLRP